MNRKLIVALSLFLVSLASIAADQTPSNPASTKAEKRAITLTFDASGAELELAALDADVQHAEAAADLAVHNADVQASIAHAHDFMPDATTESFKGALIAAATGATDKLFGMNEKKAKLNSIRALIGKIKSNSNALTREISARLQSFAPQVKPMTVRVALIVGGGSDGFQTDDVPNTFFLDVSYFDEDMEGVALLASHELFHVIQAHERPTDAAIDPDKSGLSQQERRIMGMRLLFLALENEGTASLVGDAMEWPGQNGSYVSWFHKKFQRNLAHIDQSFVQFDNLMFRASHDADAPMDNLYNLGFSGQWDSNAYFVGYRMAQAIDKYSGRGHLNALLDLPAEDFVLSYAAVRAAHPEDSSLPPLSVATIAAARELRTIDSSK